MFPTPIAPPQTPESKTSGGLAGVFKSLTGSRSSKAAAPVVSSNIILPNANVQLAQKLGSPKATRGSFYGGPSDYEKLYEQLKPGNAIAERLAAAEALRLAVADYPISGVINIWYAAKDLIDPGNNQEARRTGFELLTACVKHASSTDLERKEQFDTLTATLNPDDFHLQLAALAELTKNGRDLSGFHYEAVPLLTGWLHSAFQAFERARVKGGVKSGQGRFPLGEETNLQQLFDFITQVIKFSFIVADDADTGHLIDEVILIATSTRFPKDIRACVRVLDAIVTYGAIPDDKLKEFIKVLCSMYLVVRDVRDEAWQTLSNLCKSHNGYSTVIILLEVLQSSDLNTSPSTHLREVRGALSVIDMILAENGENGFPTVPFALLMESIGKALSINHVKVELDVLRLILGLFNEDSKRNILEDDWTEMLDIVVKCSLRASETSDGRPVDGRAPEMSPTLSLSTGTESSANVATTIAQMLYSIIAKIEQLLMSVPTNEFAQRESSILFFRQVHAHLPESSAKLVIDFYAESRFCYPSDLEWKSNIQMLLDAFFSNRFRTTSVRLQALKAVTDVYEIVEMMAGPEDEYLNYDFVAAILGNVVDEKDNAVLESIVAFAVTVADKAEPNIFDYVIKQLRQCFSNDPLNSPLLTSNSRVGGRSPLGADPTVPFSTPANIVARGIVQIFIHAIHKSTAKALLAFDEILWIAKTNSCDTDARVSAMKLLFRLRADWANRIFLTPFTESGGLASSLFRTSASLARKQAVDEALQSRILRGDDTRGLRNSTSGQSYTNLANARSTGNVNRTVQKHQQLWSHPDLETIPEETAEKASILLVSIIDKVDEKSESIPSDVRALKVNIWLETIIGLLQQGSDWEVYSYVLVYLPSQLTNQALFRDAIPQIKLLRSVLCEQIKNSTFQEPPVSTGLRKSEVAICLFQALTMVMSYHKHFSRGEEDEIVKCFIHGVGAYERSAKCCIHALSICCHELPASMRLVLVNLLLKMSQIITQAHVAVHILEFLTGLARLPELYSNFREEEYRTVFGIAFRYLQYVRDQNSRSNANRYSSSSVKQVLPPAEGPGLLADVSATESNLLPNSSDDLPQYVYALAFHVITFWFLSLRLPDRAGQVGWISKNLVWADDFGKQRLDEQAEVTIDFMRRTAYADVDESKVDQLFTSERFGEILRERYLVGESIVTIEQSIRNGWAQVTRRHPSGTSHWMVRQKYEPPPPHQVSNSSEIMRGSRPSDANVVYPANLLVQLIASTPISSDVMRPIHLPNDDMVQRAISSFDRISTVDGHKVGLIYIGDDQTEEVDILSNVMGSSDFQDLLSRLGTLTKLKGAQFNTQGLDRQYNSDGEYTYCWRDRVSEIVFHVTTLMPTNLENDPQCIGKKRHIGNDFVNIIFNNSGLQFNFDTFPSDFNYVNIVITPESRASFVATRLRSATYADTAFYKVQVMSKEGFPEISPAAETKTLSLKALPDFVRLLALNASVFSLVWANRAGGEHISSWRNRLREIVRLREKYGTKQGGGTPLSSPPGTAQSGGLNASEGSKNVRDGFNSLRRTSVANFLTNTGDGDRPAKASSTGETETDGRNNTVQESMVEAIDFSRWA